MLRRTIATGAFAMLLAGSAAAQTWPNKPVHLIVSFTPGSATDVIARSMSNELSARLGQPVIIEDKPGAGGTIAAALVAKSAPNKPAEFDAMIVRELAENRELVKAAGIKPQ